MRGTRIRRGLVVRTFGAARVRLVIAVLAVASIVGWQVGVGGAATSGPVTVAFSSKIQALDPATGLGFPDGAADHLIGGTLTTYFGSATGKLSPGLASSYSVSPNGLTWTFTLRKNLRFSNGMPLTSADVTASFNRARNDKSNANVVEFLPITSITAPNATTVVITMNRRYPSFPTILGGTPWAIFPAKLIATKGFFNHPISAGPYALTAWGGTNNASFSVNKNYWGPKPVVPTIEFETNPDPSSALAEVESGQLDVAFGLPARPDLPDPEPGTRRGHDDVWGGGHDHARARPSRSTSRPCASRSPTRSTGNR